MNPYDVLGVSPKATADEITVAFKALVQIFHPDRYQSSPDNVRFQADRLMKQLNEAYLALRNANPMTPGWTSPNGAAPASSPAPPSGAWKEPPAAATRVSWDQSERQRAAQARKAEEARLARERAAAHGEARARPKSASERSPVVFGLGQALPTGRLTCRGCSSIQRLPAGWKELIDSHNFYCSICGRIVLAVERPSGRML